MKIHPFANFLPDATDEEYRNIKDDIADNGLQVPILLFNNMVLDGRTRLRCCMELGIEPKFEFFRGTDAEALRYVQSLNIFRRHLTPAQKAAAGRCIAEELVRQTGMTVKEATAQAAKATGASVSSINRVKTIHEDKPELAEKVLNGETTLREAERERNPTPRPIQSYRYLSSAIADLRRSIDELGRLKCPDKSRLKDLLTELETIRDDIAAWANRRCSS